MLADRFTSESEAVGNLLRTSKSAATPRKVPRSPSMAALHRAPAPKNSEEVAAVAMGEGARLVLLLFGNAQQTQQSSVCEWV